MEEKEFNDTTTITMGSKEDTAAAETKADAAAPSAITDDAAADLTGAAASGTGGEPASVSNDGPALGTGSEPSTGEENGPALGADNESVFRLDDDTQVIDIDYISVDEDGNAEIVRDPDATLSGIEPEGRSEEGFSAGNPAYDEHEQRQTAYAGAAAGAYGSAGSYSPAGSPGMQAAQVQRGFITKKAFALILIFAMMLTMLASVGITAAYTTYLNNKTLNSINTSDDHATNYTLTESDESLSYKSIIQKTQDSVVSITTESVTNDIWMQNYVTQGAGSGVIIESDGYIITCQHVIEGARKITVTMRDGKEYDATIVGADAENDIAVIKIDATGLKAATYGDSSKLEVGDTTVVIGNPLGRLSGTVTTGIISALDRKLTIDNRTMTLLQTDASINPGNSGGGMFDASGNLIGIVEAKSTGSDIDGLGFATPINKAAKIAKELIENEGSNDQGGSGSESSGTPKIGVTVAEIDDSIAEQYGYAHGGLLVRQISSPQATLSGITEGDIIFKADGKNVADMEDLTDILSGKKAGDKLKLQVARQDGSTAELTTVLVSAQDAR